MIDGIIFDHHALVAVGRGHPQLAGFIVTAQDNPLFTLAVPALCLAEATRQRVAISTHVAQLSAVEVFGVDRISADTMGRLAASRFPVQGWPTLHAVVTSLVMGWEIATSCPEDYEGYGVPLMPVKA